MLGGSRRALLVTALGFVGCDATLPDPTVEILRSWLSSWRGLGLVGRATFYVSGREHSPTGASGSAFETTPFRAVQAAAWETLARG